MRIPFTEAIIELGGVESPDALYFDPELSVEDRIADLLPRMTLEEKLEQLCSDLPTPLLGVPEDSIAQALQKQHPHGLGRYTQYSVAGLISPEQAARLANAIQDYYRNHTRLGIPVMLQTENLSGYSGAGGQFSPPCSTPERALIRS